jgi:hypothetical protein
MDDHTHVSRKKEVRSEERIYSRLDWKEIEKKEKKIEGHIPCHVNVLEMDLAFSTCTW